MDPFPVQTLSKAKLARTLIVAAVLALLPPVVAAQPATQEPLPTFPFLVYVKSPNGEQDLTRTQVMTSDPDVWDHVIDSDPTATYVGVNVGAHQPEIKLVCQDGWN